MNCLFQSIEENTPFTKMIDNLMLMFKRKLLNIEIRIAFWKLDRLQKENLEIKNRSVCLGNPSLVVFFASQEKSFGKQYNNNLRGLNSKFDVLSGNQLINHTRSDTDKFILMNCVETSERNNIRYSAPGILKKAVKNNNISPFDSFVFFKDNPNILCMRSDMGGKTVFMAKDVYDGNSHWVSEFASNILGKLNKSEYHIRNSYDFQSFISNCTYEEEEEMVSFDVVSLFTNAQVNKTIEIIINLLNIFGNFRQ